jgi:hypothetical protein
MKKLLLSCFVAMGFAAAAQVTTTNIAVNMTSPTANATVTPGVAVPITVEITNNGTTALTTSDSLLLFFSLNGNVIQGQGGPLIALVRQNIAVNATYTANVNLTFNSIAASAAANFCSNVIHISATDTDSTNNSSCASVNLIQGTVSSNDAYVSVFQNASFFSNGMLNLNLSGLVRNEMVTAEVLNIAGQVVMTQTVQANDGVIKTEVPVNAASGLMLYRITNSRGEVLATEKFMAH